MLCFSLALPGISRMTLSLTNGCSVVAAVLVVGAAAGGGHRLTLGLAAARWGRTAAAVTVMQRREQSQLPRTESRSSEAPSFS